jgi:hypothetical protein
MKKLTTMMIALLGLGITGSALAGTIVSAYGGKGGTPVGKVVPPTHGTPSGTITHTGTLPFTGFDLTVFAGLALLLIALGILLVRSSRPKRTEA